MPSDNAPSRCQPKADTTRLSAPRFLKSHEWLESFSHPVVGDPWSAVVDPNGSNAGSARNEMLELVQLIWGRAPVDYRAGTFRGASDLMPRGSAVNKSEAALHELVGELAYRWRSR